MAVWGTVLGKEQAEALWRRVVQIASERADGLDRCLSLMTDHAWVGGGAPAFSRELADRRQALQGAFQSALDEVAEVVRSAGGTVSRTDVRTHVAWSCRSGSYIGIELGRLDQLVAGLDRSGKELKKAAGVLSGELARAGVATAKARTVGEIGEWAVWHSRDLRRRRDSYLDGVGKGPDAFSASVVGFGLFGAYAADPHETAPLLWRAQNGDKTALGELLGVQRSNASPELAKRINAWWLGLPADKRQELIKGFPGLVGALDGLPAVDRDKANRLFLASEKARLQKKLRGLIEEGMRADPRMDRKSGSREEAIRDIQGKLAGIAALELRLAQGGTKGRPPYFLLGFDTQTVGHAIVSVGNPDLADNVVNYVPGYKTNLSKVGGGIGRAVSMWQQADSLAPDKKHASIFWLGYDPPQGGDTGFAGDANRGVPLLSSFMSGLSAARQVPTDARVTLLGHSYGSLVVGKTVKASGPQIADNLIFVGSPGVGVDRAEDLGIPPTRVWAGAADHDNVPDLWPWNPLRWLGEYGHFGRNPASDRFGGRRFDVPPGPLHSEVTFKSHSIYWQEHTDSLANMGRVVTGQYEQVKWTPIPTLADLMQLPEERTV